MCVKPNTYWEVTELFEKPDKELVQLNLSLCPNCAFKYRALRKKLAIMEKFKNSIIESYPKTNQEIVLDNEKIRFTETHLAELKEMLIIINSKRK